MCCRNTGDGQEGDDDARGPRGQDDASGQLGCEDSCRCGHAGYHCGYFEGNGVHGWALAALLEEMKGMKGTASFESCETDFRYFTHSRCIRQGGMEAPTVLDEVGIRHLVEHGATVGGSGRGALVRCARGQGVSDLQHIMGGQLLDHERLQHVAAKDDDRQHR